MVEQILAVLRIILEWVRQQVRRKERENAQEQRDALEKDPAQWFDQHFSGSAKRLQPDDADTGTDADQADIADRTD